MSWRYKVKTLVFLLTVLAVLAGCTLGGGTPTIPTPQEPTPTLPSPQQSEPTLPATSQPTLPAGTASPTNPAGTPPSSATNPLTGLPVTDVDLLDRRPLAVKIENLPRNNRPQHGMSLADLVYEYYTEEGTTRFISVFYGQDAERVGPVRSARFFDSHIVRMYKAVFAFASAYQAVLDRLRGSEFSDRLVIETRGNCPPMCRYGSGRILVTNTADLSAYATRIGIDNRRQDLSGMTFSSQASTGGQALDQVVVRYSGAIYNRWDYDTASDTYLRSVDQQNASSPAAEVYGPLTDALTGERIAASNVVVLFVEHEYFTRTATTEVFEMNLSGSGDGYALRDGNIYEVNWERPSPDSVLRLTLNDGTPYGFKPGNTWFEVMTPQSRVDQEGNSWRFTFVRP